jgi:hypothetical protein
MEEAIDAAFDEFEATLGEFDRGQAFEEAARLFRERLEADPEGMAAALQADQQTVAADLFQEGAQLAAGTRRGYA